MKNALEISEVKIKQLISNMTTEEITQKILKGVQPIDLCSIILDIDWTPEALQEWLNCLQPKPSPKARDEIRQMIDQPFPQVLMESLQQNNISMESALAGLINLSSSFRHEDILEILLDLDFSYHEILIALEGKENYFQRTTRLQEILKKSQTSSEVWQAYCLGMPLLDQLILCHALNFTTDHWALIAKNMNVNPSLFQTFSPPVYCTHLEKQLVSINKWIDALLPTLEKFNKNKLGNTLLGREFAIKRWFRTAGPYVKGIFVGVLKETVPCSPGVQEPPKGKNLNLPDFRFVLYQEGIVRAQHIGIDGHLTTDEVTRTIAHSYQGRLEQDKISLHYCANIPDDPLRPHLGDLLLKNFSIDSSGRVASFLWDQQSIHADWHPGFQAL